jgi:putative ABC transport system permease protein
MLCIAWGLTSLVLVSSVSDGFRKGQRSSLARFGDGIVSVWGGQTEMQAGGRRSGREIRFSERDVQVIKEQCSAVQAVAGQISSPNVLVAGEARSARFNVLGITPDYLDIRRLPVGAGRQIRWRDEHNSSRVCVLGWLVQDQLFDQQEGIIGKEIIINGYPYSVIGLRSRNDQAGSQDGIDDDKIMVPLSSLRRDFPPLEQTYEIGALTTIVYRPTSLDLWQEAQHQVRRTLSRIHNFDPSDSGALRFWDTEENARTTESIIGSIEHFLSAVAFITLALGGVNVMNIMMICVAERTREIGVRKAVGATQRRILLEFMLEGSFLALIGGLVGFVLVLILAPLVNAVQMSILFAGVTLELRSAVFAAVVLGAVAVLSAFPPAFRAARLTPVEALRKEY